MRNFILMILGALSLQPAIAEYVPTPVSQMENLGRGFVVIPCPEGKFVSWRFLGTDDDIRTSFRVYRDGTSTYVSSGGAATSYLDTNGTASSVYSLVTYYDGVVVDSITAKPWTNPYFQLHLSRPADGSNADGSYSYTPNDCSVGDVDGDGEYELFVKWDPSNSKDNSQNGITGNVYIDCYRLTDIYNGGEGATPERLWRIDLGVNIRAGAHYTQYMVYDFDGDGKAELMCKTGPGSLDGKGNYVNQVATDATIKAADNTKDWRNSGGRVNGGHEYLTVFNGETGAAIHTIPYLPNRNQTLVLSDATGTKNWGDVDNKNDAGSYGNRGERYLAAVAYLDGPDKPASGIFSRGYYGYAFIWAVDFDGKELHNKWLSANTTKTSATLYTWDAAGKRTQTTQSGLKQTSSHGIGSGSMFGNGNHNLSVADVDGDGCDEIVWGSAALNNDGRVLYATGYGHGDAIHLADHCPDRPGLEVFQVHEDKLYYAWDLHDAATGEILLEGGPEGQDNGRGIAGAFHDGLRGSIFWSSSDGSARFAGNGAEVSGKHGTTNFRMFWDGDLQEELLDGNQIDKWNGNGTTRIYVNSEKKNPWDYNGSSTCNSTKKTPNLAADLFGDWREELILWSSNDNSTLNIFSTTTASNYAVPTLMHDHTYRMGVCWQNVAYNQPPHLGYYLPDYFDIWEEFTSGCDENAEWCQTMMLGDSITPIDITFHNTMQCKVDSCYYPDGTKTYYTTTGFSKKWTLATRNYHIEGKPQMAGDYVFKLTASNPKLSLTKSFYFTLHVVDPSGMAALLGETSNETPEYFTIMGRRVGKVSYRDLPGGLYIMKQGATSKKVFKP